MKIRSLLLFVVIAVGIYAALEYTQTKNDKAPVDTQPQVSESPVTIDPAEKVVATSPEMNGLVETAQVPEKDEPAVRKKFKIPDGPKYLLDQYKTALENLRNPPAEQPASNSYVDITSFLLMRGQSDELARFYIERIRTSASNGEPEALRSLGELIEGGLIEPEEPGESFNLFLSAANAGDAEAARYVGFHLANGLGMEADPEAALEWYRKAIELGNVDAWVDISDLYVSTAFGKPDFNTALKCLETAAKSGSSEAEVATAVHMLSLQNKDKLDMDAVLTLLNSAARAGNSRAHALLASLYAKEEWGIQDKNKGFAHLVVAADLGEGRALYARGSAGLQSSNENFYYQGLEDMSSLTSHGSTQAAMKLVDHLVETQSSDWTDEALDLLEWSGEMGNEKALFRLIRLASDGQQTGIPNSDAQYWLDKLTQTHRYSGYLIADLVEQNVSLSDAALQISEMDGSERYVEYLRIKSLNNQVEISTDGYSPPRPIHAPAPEYPAVLRMQKIEGEAVVRFVVRKDGTASNFVIQSATHPAFAKAAVEALEQWKFEPAYSSDNTKVNVRTRIAVPFRIRK